MTDIFSPEKRSEIMSLIRSKNTKGELIAFSHLRKQRIYFQKHYDKIKGKPDIALPRRKKAVFIDGDFWHGKTLDRLVQRQGQNSDYWIPKIKRNMERDVETDSYLFERGWEILRVWERDLVTKRTRTEVLQRIEKFLSKEVL